MNRVRPRLVTTTEARARYGATSKTLDAVEPEMVLPNPYDPRGPAMRLYRVADVARAAHEPGESHPVPTTVRVTMRWPATADELVEWVRDVYRMRGLNRYPPGPRGIVAAIRHWGTTYDDVVANVTGGRMHWVAIRERVDAMVVEELRGRYPRMTDDWDEWATRATAHR